MDEEHTAAYSQPCEQCCEVDWGISDEGRFYCRSCHNVIERIKEVTDQHLHTPGQTRITKLQKGAGRSKTDSGRKWFVCEGFQFILMHQADCLIAMGVNPRFKDEVLLQFWRMFLQKSKQAFCIRPSRGASYRMRSVSESEAESFVSESDGETLASTAGSDSDWSVCSGSADALSYLSPRQRRTRSLLDMKKTLALLHIALVWSREPITLSQLIRLVKEGHLPYIHAYEQLPEEMRIRGKDTVIFRVHSIPSYGSLHREAQRLILYLDLFVFPPITRQSLLHPALLSLQYLADANLPDAVYPWLLGVLSQCGLSSQQSFDTHLNPSLPQYDTQAAALIIVTLKMLFGLDDHTEWDLSTEAEQEDTGNQFSLRKWYKLLQAALIRGQKRKTDHISRKQWKPKAPLHSNKREKYKFLKQTRISEQVKVCFQRLSAQTDSHNLPLSSFRFCWEQLDTTGDSEGQRTHHDFFDGPSMQHKQLDSILKKNNLTPSNTHYWHTVLRVCSNRHCPSHYPDVEPTLSRSFVWLLRLFGFLLDVPDHVIYEQWFTVVSDGLNNIQYVTKVLRVERCILGDRSKGEEEEEEEKKKMKKKAEKMIKMAGIKSKTKTKSKPKPSPTKAKAKRKKAVEQCIVGDRSEVGEKKKKKEKEEKEKEKKKEKKEKKEEKEKEKKEKEKEKKKEKKKTHKMAELKRSTAKKSKTTRAKRRKIE